MRAIHRLLPILLATAAHPALATDVVEIADRDVDGLVAAIHRANQSRQATTIQLAEGGLYTLVTASDENRELGLPAITGDITLIGRNADLRRYSNEDFALLAVADGGRLKASQLTLAEGSRGAVVNRGELELNAVRVVDNVAKDVPAIVENYGRLRVRDSEISYNQLAGAQRDAGTVLNYGELELVGSSIESNWISRRYDSLIAASAVLNLGELKLAQVRIRENTAMPELAEASLGAIVNAGNGAYQASGLTLENNEPVDTAYHLGYDLSVTKRYPVEAANSGTVASTITRPTTLPGTSVTSPGSTNARKTCAMPSLLPMSARTSPSFTTLPSFTTVQK